MLCQIDNNGNYDTDTGTKVTLGVAGHHVICAILAPWRVRTNHGRKTKLKVDEGRATVHDLWDARTLFNLSKGEQIAPAGRDVGIPAYFAHGSWQ